MLSLIVTIIILLFSIKMLYVCLDTTEYLIMLLFPLFSIIFCLSFINYQANLVYNETDIKNLFNN